MSEFLTPPQEFKVNILKSHNPEVESQIAEINRLHQLSSVTGTSISRTDEKNPSQVGFTIPGEYGGTIENRIVSSLEKNSPTTFLYITAIDGKVIGYRETEIFPEGENPEDFRVPIINPEAVTAISGPHMEGRESAIHPDYRTLKDSLNRKPSEILLSETEEYCRSLKLPYLLIWIIGHGGPHIPNKASWKFFTRHGYYPALTSEGEIDNTRAAGLYKKIV